MFLIDTIVVRASDLIALASDLQRHKIDHVRLSLEEADLSDPDLPIPAVMFVSGIRSSDAYSVIEFDEIEAADIDTSEFIACVHTNIVD